MKVIIAPDKFKGSLTSFEVCAAIEKGIKAAAENITTLSFPMADGGDGFAAVFQHYLHSQTVACDTIDPLGRQIKASYQWQAEKKTAIIELASASGLHLLSREERHVSKASTYGTGLLIKDAIEKGANKIILGLGGSATNDMGSGILAALGFSFIDEAGEPVAVCGGNLNQVEQIICPAEMPVIQFEIACDVQNVLTGPAGATYIYAAQKGAAEAELEMLDAGLKKLAAIAAQKRGIQVTDIPGTGAAGGVAAGLIPFFNTSIHSGIDMLISASGIRNSIAGADLLITGEGRFDSQTLHGKLVSAIALLAKQYEVPVVVFCGISEAGDAVLEKLSIRSVQTIVSELVTQEEAIANAASLLTERVYRYFITEAGNPSPGL